MDFGSRMAVRLHYIVAVSWLIIGVTWLFLWSRGWPPDLTWLAGVNGILGFLAGAAWLYIARKKARSSLQSPTRG